MIDCRRNYERWISECAEFRDELMAMGDSEITDAFDKDLEFGTAGLRGIMGAGTNRMNVYVVRKATQGLAEYLKNKFKNRLSNGAGDKNTEFPSVAIAYDSRNNSQKFAEEAALVLAANGIKVYIYSELMPVPVLSFTVRRLGTDCGIVITASHNSMEYNGYKVYGSDGGQILSSQADEILECIDRVDIFNGIKTVPFDEANTANSLIEYVKDEIYEEYLEAMLAATDIADNSGSGEDEANRQNSAIDIVYTPLNGSGLKPVTNMMDRCGFVYRIPQMQKQLDGDFPTCPYPNPEKLEAYSEALKEAKGCDIIVATDPDCDRVGCMVKTGDGEYKLLTGNEIGTLFTYYMCSMKCAKGKTIVSSIVSTPLIDRITAEYGVNIIRTLVGFKYIGEQMNKLQGKFLLGFEESNGYLTGLYARDKDGIGGVRMICTLAAYYKERGMTLIDVLEEIYERFGVCINRTVNRETEGAPFMKKIRESIKKGTLPTGVAEIIDYSAGVADLPKADVIQLNYDDGARMIVRPSGTEPKVKLYVSAPTEKRAEEIAAAV